MAVFSFTTPKKSVIIIADKTKQSEKNLDGNDSCRSHASWAFRALDAFFKRVAAQKEKICSKEKI